MVDGRAIARELLLEVRESVASLGRIPVVRAVSISPTRATESYLKIKERAAEEAGMRLEIVRLEENASTTDVLTHLKREGAHAVILQLPLPPQSDTQTLCDAIPLVADADVLSEAAYKRFASNEAGALLPPVVGAIAEILERTNVNPQGKRIVVVGGGKLVGAPSAQWLSRFSAVDMITKEEGELSVLKEADIVVLGAGQAGLVQPSMLKEGVVLIDAGASESNGTIAGDAHPSCASVASVFTPVPGGVGPITVACLFKNVSALVKELA